MALGYWGKARMGQRNTATPPRPKGGVARAVGGPRPDSTASWPRSPAGSGPIAWPTSGFERIKGAVAQDYSKGNPEHGRHRGGQRKVHKVMQEFKEGTLRSSSGQKVKSRKQAIAIALSEAGLSRKR